MQKLWLGFGVAGVVLVGGWYLASMNNSEEVRQIAEKQLMEEQQQMDEKAMLEKETMEKADMMKAEAEVMDNGDDMMKEDTIKADMMKEEDQAMSGDEAMMKKAGVYAPYEASKLAMAQTGDVVLFFKASWCPSCRTVDADIKANLTAIPAHLTILEVDYDTSAALKQKYGVTTQHTFVQVDASGALIKKWSGGATLASVVAQVQ